MTVQLIVTLHFNGEDAAEKEATFVAEMQELVADILEEVTDEGDEVIGASTSGQHTGFKDFVRPVVSEPSGVGAGELDAMEVSKLSDVIAPREFAEVEEDKATELAMQPVEESDEGRAF